MRGLLYWRQGPLLAIALVALVSTTNGGPGFFFLSMFAAALLLVAMPLVQLGLLAFPALKGQHRLVAIIALTGIAVLVVLLGASGIFSFW